MGFDFHYMLELMPILLKYLGTTMEMATLGLVYSASSTLAFSAVHRC